MRGASMPKPLIEVRPGKRMISYVIDFLTLQEPHRFIFVCHAEHERSFGITSILRAKVPGCEVLLTPSVTTGPAATALLAAPLVDDDHELLLAYCDSFLTIDLSDFLTSVRGRGASGGVLTYPSSDRAESYAEVAPDGTVLRTAEKQVISPYATSGFYYFAKGRDFVSGARTMMERSGPGPAGEFFVCPVFNELIASGKRVVAYPLTREQRVEMGTPEDMTTAQRWLADHAEMQVAQA